MKNTVLTKKMILISTDQAGQRIDNFLITYLKNVPKSRIYRILRKGNVRINKKRIKPEYKLNIGDEVRIPPIRICKHQTNISSLHSHIIKMLSKVILYEDDYILALNKPSGIAVHGGSGSYLGIIEIFRLLRPTINFLSLVHRLDRDTSGVLLMVKKYSTLRSLHKQLRDKWIQKEYLVLVRGQWKSQVTKVQAPLLKNVLRDGKRIVRINQKGKASETHFKVQERYKFATLLCCRPITGRTHQIRVHVQYLGHPVAFDDKYGDREFDKKLATTGLTRLFLHATSLQFIHPHTKKYIRIEAPLDAQLKHCIEMLRS